MPILADDDCAERAWSVNGAVNLLSDGLGEMRPPVPADATDEFTRGRMQPDLNGTREAFEREDYAQGSTAEVAGHGLYGDYALFIPRSVISLEGAPATRSWAGGVPSTRRTSSVRGSGPQNSPYVRPRRAASTVGVAEQPAP